MTTLIELKPALEQPFPVEAVQFLLKDIRQEGGKSTCLALPYCNKRVYEDRLNELAYGEWQTHYVAPYTQGNKLIIPASVTLCGVTHMDYGEAFLLVPAKNGSSREDENSATEAYSQAFRRACSKFGLGRYLYNLGKLRLPYDPEHKQLAITKGEHIAWVEKLYMDAGLQPQSRTGAGKRMILPASTLTAPAPQQTVVSVHSDTSSPLPPKAKAGQDHQSGQPTSYPDDLFLDWVAQQVARDPQRIQGICAFYQVTHLTHLSQPQRENLTLRLKRQKEKEQQTTSIQS